MTQQQETDCEKAWPPPNTPGTQEAEDDSQAQQQTPTMALLEFFFQEQSYWTVQLGQSLALDHSRRCLSVVHRVF